MLQPKDSKKHVNRLRLDIESKTPSMFQIEHQLEESKGRRGCLVELPFKTNKPGQLFILSVQWDEGPEQMPVWTLYEQDNHDGKMHWSQTFAYSDLSLLYEVLYMTVTPAENKPKPPDPPRVEPPPAPALAAQPAPAPQPAAAPPPAMPMAPMPGYPPADYASQQASIPPGYAYPPGYYPPPVPGQPYPGMPGAAYPPPGYPPVAGYPPQPPAYPPSFGDPGQWVANYQPQQETSAPRGRLDMDLLSKKAKIDLGTLLLNARLINQGALEAAIKIQGMVEDGKISEDDAPAALAKHHAKGASIDTILTEEEIKTIHENSTTILAGGAKGGGGAPGTASDGKPQAPGARTPQQLRAALDLLIEAGIISEDDITTASKVRAKHGGDTIGILQAANKFDKHTFDAAIICLPMAREGLMKKENIIIALNYCLRSRVTFDTALDELGWPNPRKLRKDLPL